MRLLFLLACGAQEGTGVGDCTDAADNDGDGLFDCADDGCFGSPDCADEADADTDSDADADSDADTDTAPPGYEWEHLDPFVQPEVWVEPFPLEPGGEATVYYYGELSKAHSLVLHHGFNGWNAVEGLDDMEVIKGGDPGWFRETEMTRDGHGGLEATVTLPTDGRAMHMVFYDPTGDVWDSNEGLDWGWAFELPFIGPYITWDDTAQPHNGAVINFETSLPCLGAHTPSGSANTPPAHAHAQGYGAPPAGLVHPSLR